MQTCTRIEYEESVSWVRFVTKAPPSATISQLSLVKSPHDVICKAAHRSYKNSAVVMVDVTECAWRLGMVLSARF